jgi:exodeoxyribonuclease VII small subunit
MSGDQRTSDGPTGDRSTGDGPTGDGPTYEEAREELVDVVRRLESGGTDLEESLALWERGEKLAAICQAFLDGARQRLDEALGGEASPTG